ncbi:hypothetical protein D3C85_1325050 [compost metagenome]
MSVFDAFFYLIILQRSVFDFRLFGNYLVVENIFFFSVFEETGPFSGFFSLFVVAEYVRFSGRVVGFPFSAEQSVFESGNVLFFTIIPIIHPDSFFFTVFVNSRH